MIATRTLSAGFSDPVHESQRAFRAALQALSRPGQIVHLGAPLPGVALPGAMAHLLLTLTDDETPVAWQHENAQSVQWLRFHTSAPLAPTRQQAAFAVITDASRLPPLDGFALGTAQSPEFSTTLLIEVPSLTSGARTLWRGPGIKDCIKPGIAGLDDEFWSQWSANHGRFPQGVDIIFCCADSALGLPRSTRIAALKEV